MMRSIQVSVLFAVSVFSLNVYSYKETTHEDLSSNAVEISNISQDQSLLTSIGLESFSSKQKFTNPSDPAGIKLTITELIKNGAKFEDESPRFLHHFYNPINDAPLIVGVALGFRSPDWALEDTGDVESALAGSQEYSYKEALDYYYSALTAQTKELRDLNWGKLFQSLGHVIHHVQDMAQPDYVRNDQHDHVTDPSWYETYTDDHRGDVYFKNLMSGNAYPIPEFPTARDFWTTRAADPDVVNRRGIADFTNRNFVSKDTIFLINNGTAIPGPALPLPVPDITPTTVDIADPSIKGVQGRALCNRMKERAPFTFPDSACYIDFVSTPITGATASEAITNTRAASYSIFDKKVQDHNVDSIYIREDGGVDTIDRSLTLNEFNFNAAHQYLIPRAVAFSAGLLNHFFNRTFTVTIDTVNGQFIIKNISDYIMYGQFNIYGELLSDNDNLQRITTWDVPANGFVSNTEMVVDIPDLSGYKNEIKLIYRGRVGDTALVDRISSVIVSNDLQ